ncbi:MAG: precorrin-2 C(20)-methyltransferase [Lachnospiraceae bacterium]|nr:precorrin-2 C(20)-methyltransferase [Lachnospiraceae bacterium]MDE6981312.1 precorrin-2 C(20)-methyltransferase [Lachnospiraceae bacterium]
MKKGKLFGVGVGPGDPELITLKALRVIEESSVIAVPGERAETSTAYRIALGACKNLSEKETAALPMPMTKKKEILRESHLHGAKILAEYLDQGKQVAFLTLGDPSVYSTYLYVKKILEGQGYDTEMVSGIPSFCAAAAALNVSLSEQAESIHIIPASYPIGEALKLSGTKVLMKSGKKLGEVKEQLLARGADVKMVENCGMEGERHYLSAQEMPDEGSYYSLIVVKE